ncbi:MAG TPA: glycerol kinase GlpK [Vitreimonas sp.]|nr:glycerol kinase GlpK [Vitreimonas sp.]
MGPSQPLILALDQGTTSSRAIAFDHDARPVAAAQREIKQSYPAPGHVEHDPEEIWATQLEVAREVIGTVGGPERILAIGIANQRETTIVWERATGSAVAPAIVWQSRVTAPFCDQLRREGHEPSIRASTGLRLDPYFSGPKVRHILRETGRQKDAERGALAFGTVDAFLVSRLTGGRVHATDVSNASRTLMLDLQTRAWNADLVELMEIPPPVLPEVRPSSEVWAETEPALFGRPIRIAGVAGDQQAAMFGQACFAPGEAKNTYGTGAFLLMNTGDRPVPSSHGLLTTILWQLGAGGPTSYALEGSVFVAGAAVQWIRDGLRAIHSSADVEALARDAAGPGGIYLVPAFVGLGAPHWDPRARGLLIGLTRGTGLPEIARAAVDSMAYQVSEVAHAMSEDAGRQLEVLRVDGGAAANDALLAFQADLLGLPVRRPAVVETTALGAAFLAGLGVGFWRNLDEVRERCRHERQFEPGIDGEERDRLMRGWRRAVERAKGWDETDLMGPMMRDGDGN